MFDLIKRGKYFEICPIQVVKESHIFLRLIK